MKRGLIIAAFTAAAAAASPLAAKTMVLQGVHSAAKVATMCKLYGGTFTSSAKGHGCSRKGYGKVWCSTKGHCVARLEDGFDLAQK